MRPPPPLWRWSGARTRVLPSRVPSYQAMQSTMARTAAALAGRGRVVVTEPLSEAENDSDWAVPPALAGAADHLTVGTSLMSH
jgi:hypothetical protein